MFGIASTQPMSSSVPSLILPVSAGSESHIAVLTNDNFWRVYHVDDLTVAEQTFELQLNPDRWDLSDNSKASATASHFSAGTITTVV